MINNFRAYIPFQIKLFLKKIIYLGKRYYCNCCGSYIRSFCYGGEDLPVILENKIIGAGFRKQDYCPVCKSTYRHRLLWLYLNEFRIWDSYKSILHVAPEEMIARKLSRIKQIFYVTGDSNPDRYRHYAKAIKIDITQIPFADKTFDIIICNHVLEHIIDDRLAMNELNRVLNTGGFAILQVPLSEVMDKTYENPIIVSEEERLKHFGQIDHVRIYSKKDYFQRLASSGFSVTEYKPYSHSKYYLLNKLALNPVESVIIAVKSKTD